MPRTPYKFNNTEFAFEEKLRSEDGDNIFIEDVKVTERNGGTLQDQYPGWIRVKNGSKNVKSDGTVERTAIVIFDPTNLFPVNTHTIELIGSDGKTKASREIYLTIQGVPKIGSNFQYHRKSDNVSSGFQGNFLITSQVDRKVVPVTNLPEPNVTDQKGRFFYEVSDLNQFDKIEKESRLFFEVSGLDQFNQVEEEPDLSFDITKTSLNTEKHVSGVHDVTASTSLQTNIKSGTETDTGFPSSTIETDVN